MASLTAYGSSWSGGSVKLQLLAYATDTAMLKPSRISDPRCSFQQYRILNPLSEARDRTCILTNTTLVCNLLSHNGNSQFCILFQYFFRTYLFGLSNYLWTYPSGSLINEPNKSLASTHCIFVWVKFSTFENYILTPGDNTVHPRLGFTAIDRGQSPRRHPKRSHCFLHTKHNNFIPVFLWVIPRNNKN